MPTPIDLQKSIISFNLSSVVNFISGMPPTVTPGLPASNFAFPNVNSRCSKNSSQYLFLSLSKFSLKFSPKPHCKYVIDGSAFIAQRVVWFHV